MNVHASFPIYAEKVCGEGANCTGIYCGHELMHVQQCSDGSGVLVAVNDVHLNGVAVRLVDVISLQLIPFNRPLPRRQVCRLVGGWGRGWV